MATLTVLVSNRRTDDFSFILLSQAGVPHRWPLSFDANLRILQPIKAIPRRRCYHHLILAAHDDRRAGADPVGGAEVGILLQVEAGGRRGPGDDDRVGAGGNDGQQRRAGGLHGRNEAPETARERVIAAGHRPAGVMLADGAADDVLAVAAGTAATRDF